MLPVTFWVLGARPTHPVRLQAYMAKQAERWRGQPFPWSPSSRHGNKLYKQWSCVLSSWALILQLIPYGLSCKICTRFCKSYVCHHIVGKFMHVIYEPIILRFTRLVHFPVLLKQHTNGGLVRFQAVPKRYGISTHRIVHRLGLNQSNPRKQSAKKIYFPVIIGMTHWQYFMETLLLVQIDVIYW